MPGPATVNIPIVPGLSAAPSHSPPSTANPIPPTTTVIIQPGDTLEKIAKAHDVGICDVVEVNAIDDPDMIIAGQILVLPTETGNRDDQSCLSY